MRVALVHDWLTGVRGGEKCLEVLCRMWPNAHLYTLIHQRGRTTPVIERMDIRTSFLQNVPGVFRHYRYLLPLMPAAIESFRLANYDLVVSLSHCVAKSIRVPASVPHICYCFTPMRYAWHMREAYFGSQGTPRTENREPRTEAEPGFGFRSSVLGPRFSVFGPRSSVFGLRSSILNCLRRWDRATADRVTHFVAISRTVQQRIRECYGRDSLVIYPPVDSEFYTPAPGRRGDFYLCVSALVPYKRLELAIEACNRLRRKLIVIGTGPEQSRLRAMAGSTVQFLGWQSDESVRDHYRRCRALLFPGLEDFGIVPLEAQACGAPVIAYGAGGATESVIPPSPTGPGTGLLFTEQSAESLADAMRQLELDPRPLCPDLARTHAEKFCTDRFAGEIEQYVQKISSTVTVAGGNQHRAA